MEELEAALDAAPLRSSARQLQEGHAALRGRRSGMSVPRGRDLPELQGQSEGLHGQLGRWRRVLQGQLGRRWVYRTMASCMRHR